MKNLEELLFINKPFNKSDIEIIEQWFTLNNKEEEGIVLISKLSKSALRKIKEIEDFRVECSSILRMEAFIDSKTKRPYAQPINDLLKKIAYEFIFYGYLDDELLKKAKETIPNLNVPAVYLVYIIYWLDYFYKINFKDYDVKIWEHTIECSYWFPHWKEMMEKHTKGE